MKKPAVLLATALSTVALAGAIGVGVASADPTPAPSAPSSSAAPTAGPSSSARPAEPGRTAHRGKRDLAARALHGEVVLGGKKHRVVDLQRGTVLTVSASSITVKSTDGFSATYVVDARTKVREDKKQASIGDVKAGDTVRLVAVKDGSTVTTRRIADRTT